MLKNSVDALLIRGKHISINGMNPAVFSKYTLGKAMILTTNPTLQLSCYLYITGFLHAHTKQIDHPISHYSFGHNDPLFYLPQTYDWLKEKRFPWTVYRPFLHHNAQLYDICEWNPGRLKYWPTNSDISELFSREKETSE